VCGVGLQHVRAGEPVEGAAGHLHSIDLYRRHSPSCRWLVSAASAVTVAPAHPATLHHHAASPPRSHSSLRLGLSRRFCRWISEASVDERVGTAHLQSTRFAVFGLGNSQVRAHALPL
jgi:hypothetical protein